jgi:ERCC4-type nuclease
MDAGNGRVHILVDDRERSCDVPAALAARGDARIEVGRLRIGDYHVERRVLVERKRIADFAISLIDGRLFRQTAALAAAAYRGVLLLEGDEAEWRSTGVRREAIQGALTTVGVFYGLALLSSATPEESARLLVHIGRQVQQSVQGGLPRSGYRPKGRRARQLFFLQGLPGLGPERAARLLDRFGSVRAIMTAPLEQIALVPGIGEKTVARIGWILDGPITAADPPLPESSFRRMPESQVVP